MPLADPVSDDSLDIFDRLFLFSGAVLYCKGNKFRFDFEIVDPGKHFAHFRSAYDAPEGFLNPIEHGSVFLIRHLRVDPMIRGDHACFFMTAIEHVLEQNKYNIIIQRIVRRFSYFFNDAHLLPVSPCFQNIFDIHGQLFRDVFIAEVHLQLSIHEREEIHLDVFSRSGHHILIYEHILYLGIKEKIIFCFVSVKTHP